MLCCVVLCCVVLCCVVLCCCVVVLCCVVLCCIVLYCIYCIACWICKPGGNWGKGLKAHEYLMPTPLIRLHFLLSPIFLCFRIACLLTFSRVLSVVSPPNLFVLFFVVFKSTYSSSRVRSSGQRNVEVADKKILLTKKSYSPPLFFLNSV